MISTLVQLRERLFFDVKANNEVSQQDRATELQGVTGRPHPATPVGVAGNVSSASSSVECSPGDECSGVATS